MSEKNYEYKNSIDFLERACKVIPLGSQTFSKSKVHFPKDSSPLFAKKAKGSYLWDLDDRKYIDFSSSLCSIILGYGDPDVNNVVLKQLEDGVIFSLPHTIETELAEEIVRLIPCAEMVRFGKNGSDATTGAIRLARAYTKRDHVAVCGYHGWQDWYIGSTSRNLGVPQATKKLTHSFQYNNIESLQELFQKYPNEIAAVIMEPMNYEFPKDNFLEKAQELCHKNKALLIFDEMITGFRYSLGGAQELFGVTPDLATFGKAIANGFPLSVIAGKAEYMHLMEEIFFSFTFGGETLSLSAALATVKKLEQENILDNIHQNGKQLNEKLNSLIQSNELQNTFKLSGHDSMIYFGIKESNDYDSFKLRTYLLQELFANGIIHIGTHNLNYCHDDTQIQQLLDFYATFLPQLKEVIRDKAFDKVLKSEPLKPLFTVR